MGCIKSHLKVDDNKTMLYDVDAKVWCIVQGQCMELVLGINASDGEGGLPPATGWVIDGEWSLCRFAKEDCI